MDTPFGRPSRRNVSPLTAIAKHSINPRSLLMSVGSVFAGTASDALRGNMEILPASLCLLFALFTQMAGNIVHHNFDLNHQINHTLEHDDPNFKQSVASMIMERLGHAAMLVAATVGLSLLALTGWWGLGVGMVIVLLEWLANYGPYPLMRTPWAILITFILFGPVCVLGTSIVQSQYEATEPYSMFDLMPAFFMSGVMGLHAIECHLQILYFNYNQDKRSLHNTFATRFGRPTTRSLFAICAVASLAIMVLMGHLVFNLHDFSINWLAFLTVPLLCLGVNLYCLVRIPNADEKEQRYLRTLLASKMAFAGIATFIAFCIIGLPSDSKLDYF
ncbi:MAG: prenyltransferase [Muribaculaceae bacterium]|nr:prenyltransferase [Muribaculaceae bacterium]MDE7188570.1 prenyltransferase [Muribaculaceae bacterium]